MNPERRTRIRNHLYAHGASRAEELAVAVGASVATIRRDLVALADAGLVDRSFGSVRLAYGTGVEVAFDIRERENIMRKRAIAADAFAMIRPHSTVFLDAGTTVLQLARLLRAEPLPVSVFTNGLAAAQEVLHVAPLRATILGGSLRGENASVIGPAAEAMLERLWFDQLFLGAHAIGDDGCIYSVDAAEASLNERMIERSASVILLADSTKFGRKATHRVTRLSPAMRILTDSGLSPERERSLVEAGLDVVLVQPGQIGSTPAGLEVAS